MLERILARLALSIMHELNPARFEKVEVKAYTTSGIYRVGLHTTVYIKVYTQFG